MCTSNERPDILADHYEHKQWAFDPNRENKRRTAKKLSSRSASGRTEMDENTTVETGPVTVEKNQVN